ncbi:UNVERIFIED_CONTAM: hypothetical protein Slati_0164100 [Sesamum latifolium]|uniref:Zinc knuckle CX2CX4HX4C domain-containing protein n=1 Tax=Sesamum latifolium TaxID=2727402 RepID=A0AAW2YBC7_9LAMI
MNIRIATFIGNKVGRFKDMEIDPSGTTWGTTLRVRVAINITLPLPRALKLKTTIGEETLVTFIYERLPNFCYLCGCLRHIVKYCGMQFEEGFQDPGTDTPYGPWLRAPLPNRNWSPLRKSKSSAKNSISTSSQRGSFRKGPAIFGIFNSIVQIGPCNRAKEANTESEGIAKSNMQALGDPTPKAPDGKIKEAMATKGAGGSRFIGTEDEATRELSPNSVDVIMTSQMVTEAPATKFGQQTYQEHDLVNIFLTFVATGIGRRGSARRRKVGSFKAVSGLGPPWTVHKLIELVRLHSPSLVFLSETKSKKRRYDSLKVRLNYFGVGIESNGKSAGLLLLWRNDIDVWIQSYSMNHIDALVKEDKDSER